ncbi:MAG: lipopolysaccharide biosynthesis protein [Spirosomataceae bacterium]
MSIKKNILKNGVANSIQKVIRLCEQILLIPFFLEAWGAEYYGEWLTLTIIPSMIFLADLGFGTAFANRFVLEYSSGSIQKSANTWKTGLMLMNGVVVGGIILSISVIIMIYVGGGFESSYINSSDASISLILIMITRFIGFYIQIYEGLFRAVRKSSASVNWQNAYSITNILVGVIILKNGMGINYISFSGLMIMILFLLVYLMQARSAVPEKLSEIGIIDTNIIKETTASGLGFLLQPLWQAVFFQGTTFIVRLTLGPVAVTVFNTVRTLIRGVNQLFNIVTVSSFPELQLSIAKADYLTAKRIFRIGLIVNLLLSISGTIILYFYGPFIYSLWTNNELSPPRYFWIFMLLGIILNSIWWSTSIIYQALNKPQVYGVPALLAAILSVFFTYFLTLKFDLSGAGLGSLVFELLLVIVVFPSGCRLINENMWELPLSIYTELKNTLKLSKIE